MIVKPLAVEAFSGNGPGEPIGAIGGVASITIRHAWHAGPHERIAGGANGAENHSSRFAPPTLVVGGASAASAGDCWFSACYKDVRYYCCTGINVVTPGRANW